jgi:RNA polymerase sigma-70 factor (ECF subfamily)
MDENGIIEDKALVAKLQQGEAEVDAFESIFHRYYPMVLNFIKGLLKDEGAAEDVSQNIFMKLWINRFKLDRNQSIRNYLCVMARNEALNVLRSKRVTSTVLQSSMPEPANREDSVNDWYNFMETNAIIRKSIDTMPPQRRTIFKMSRYENLSNMEIAIRLNLSVRTVEKHIELALKDLRKSAN